MTTTCPRCEAPVGPGSEACLACGARMPEPVASAPAAGTRGARPAGVTVLAIVYFAAAVVGVLTAVLAVLGGAFFGALFGASEGAGVGALIGAFLSVFALAFAAIAVLGGVGLWTGRKWGWYLALVVSGVNGLVDLARLAVGDVTAIGGLAVNGLVVWYLLQPTAKAWFNAA